MASGGTSTKGNVTLSKNAPAYLVDGVKDIGLCEWVLNSKKKKVSNPTVEKMMEKVVGHRADVTQTPWCAYYVGAQLEDVGISSSKSGMARSYLKWGTEVDKNDDQEWRQGDIVVFWRGTHNDGVTGHVAFLMSWDARNVYVLGGNQGDKVCVQAFKRTKMLGIRRPRHWTESRTVRAAGSAGSLMVLDKASSLVIPDVPTPDPTAKASKALEVIQQNEGPLSTLANWKPALSIMIAVATVALVAYIAWRRNQDGKQRGTQ